MNLSRIKFQDFSIFMSKIFADSFMLRMSALAGKQINQSDKGITQNYFVG